MSYSPSCRRRHSEGDKAEGGQPSSPSPSSTSFASSLASDVWSSSPLTPDHQHQHQLLYLDLLGHRSDIWTQGALVDRTLPESEVSTSSSLASLLLSPSMMNREQGRITGIDGGIVPKRTSRTSSASLLPGLIHSSQPSPTSSHSSQTSSPMKLRLMPAASSSSTSLSTNLPMSLLSFLPSPILRRPLLLAFVILFVVSSVLAYLRISSIPTELRPRGSLYPNDLRLNENDATGIQPGGRPTLNAVLDALRPDEIRTHLEYLSDDLMEGRGTGSRGEDLATLYIATQMKLTGLIPISSIPRSEGKRRESSEKDPSIKDYIVHVPLVGINTEARVSRPLTFKSTAALSDRRGSEEVQIVTSNSNTAKEGIPDDPERRIYRTGTMADQQTIELRLWEDFVFTADYQAVQSKLPRPNSVNKEASHPTSARIDWQVQADELIFLGFGIHAEEWGRNDYADETGADVDIRDKLVVCFVNEPPPTKEQPDLFEGTKLTYYGRWTYKVEEVRRRGARGIFLIYTPDTAGYPFTVISNNREPLQVPFQRFNVGLQLVAWLTEESATRLAELCENTLSEWYAAAVSPSFTPKRLPVSTAVDVDLIVRSFSAKNVMGLLPGETDECILITAHHDHLGQAPLGQDEKQDRIYNGAVDNASGVSMMLALARALATPQRSQWQRSFLFVSLTGEEAGLIGAQAYVANPPIPLAKTVANINFDMLNLDGATTDIVGLGSDDSKLGPLFNAAAQAEGLTVSGDPNPGQGSFIRSDAWIFHKAGIPAIYPWTGRHFVGRPAEYAAQRKAYYVKNKYHGPGDEYDPNWSLEGALQQGRVALRMAHTLATHGLDDDPLLVPAPRG